MMQLTENNPLHPLPANYYDLSAGEQRLARRAVLFNQSTPSDLVHAWAFFRENYLRNSDQYCTGWYDEPHYESAPFHYQFVYDLGTYARNVKAFPRGAGKSIILKELILLWALTRPNYKIVLVKSTDDFVYADFQQIMLQLEDNERILQDFGPLRPKRGKGIWNLKRLWLSNGFQLVGRSVLGKLLGLRPNFFIFDDAEFDPAMTVSPTYLTDNMKYLYFNHVRPMLNVGSSILLLGTLIHRKAFIYYMADTPEKEDPRIAFFHREILSARSDEGKLLWPEKWSEETLRMMEEEMGSAAFAAQMLNRPGTGEAALFNLHPRYGFYDIPDPDDSYQVAPLESRAQMLSWVEDAGQERQISRPFGETVTKMQRIILADPIRKPSQTSDFACVLVLGVERTPLYPNHWWVLDIRLGRAKETTFLDWLWKLGQTWQCRIVGVESIGAQKKIVEHAQNLFAERGESAAWTPRVLPIKYAGDLNTDKGKASRIAGLAWRFEKNKIHFPHHRRQEAAVRELLNQVRDATEDLRLLSKDDAIDTLAMAQFAGLSKQITEEEDDQQGLRIMRLLEKGEYYYPGTNIPLVAGLNMQELTPKAEHQLSSRRFQHISSSTRKGKIHRRRAM